MLKCKIYTLTKENEKQYAYQGRWKKEKFHGVGRIIIKGGAFLEGEFKNALNGFGRTINLDGLYYEGEYRDGSRHGYGE